MSLSKRISLVVLLIISSALGFVALSVFLVQRSQLETLVIERLEIRKSASKAAFEIYLEDIESELNLWAALDVTSSALQAFTDGWTALGSSPLEDLQRLYINDNPNPAGEKDQLLDAGDGSVYSSSHALYHAAFKALKDSKGYYDVFLIDTDGNLVYSVYKELDFATNLAKGEFAKSGLGQVFRDAMNRTDGTASFVDFAPYEPSYGAPASFIAKRILSSDGRPIGVLAFQMPIDRLNDLAGSLGDGTHAMVIGEDRLFRTSDPRFGEETILKATLDSPAIADAFSGNDSTAEHLRGSMLFLQTASPLTFLGVSWSFVVEQDRSVAFKPLELLRNIMLVTVGVSLLVAVAVV